MLAERLNIIEERLERLEIAVRALQKAARSEMSLWDKLRAWVKGH